MSTLIVKVCKIDNIERHPNADTLSVLQIGGWNVVAKTEGIEGQTHVVYIPIDAVASKDHPLLGFLEGRRVKTIKLRGIVSQGLCLPLKEVQSYLLNKGVDVSILDPEKDINLQEVLEIRKYVPNEPGSAFLGGANESSTEGFFKYTDIEHFGNYSRTLEGEKVWVSEKLHGTSARYALHNDKFLIGSRNRQLKYEVPEGQKAPVYIEVFERENIGTILVKLENEFPEASMISLYGEIAGPKIQGPKFRYGQENPSFFLYDINIDGRYLDYEDFIKIASKYEIKTVPVLAENIEVAQAMQYIDGKTVLDDHIKEGIVVKPMKEKFDPRLGRVALKIVSKEYLLKDMEDFVYE